MLATEMSDLVDGTNSKELDDPVSQIAVRARFLFERSTSQLDLDEQTKNRHAFDRAIEDRLDRWCHVVAAGDRDMFRKRLAWDGWDFESVRSLLQPSSLQLSSHGSDSLPDWATTLQSIVQIAKADSKEVADEFGIPWSDPQRPLPFEDVWMPAVRVARQRLLSCFGNQLPSILSVTAYQGLELGLRRRLMNLCARVLDEEFAKSRPLGARLLSRLISNDVDTTSNHYRAFVDSLLDDGLLGFFQSYPVLGRLVATMIDDSVEANVEFLLRLESDLTRIQSHGCPDRPLGAVVEIQPLLSDIHHHGRSVMALTFESGRRLIYKPRDLGIEAAFAELQTWCNEQDPDLAFQTVKFIPRHGYGWVEYVEHLPCSDVSASHRYYQRAGKLLCLLYALEGTDCHSENLIASGEYPMMVDAEALMQPRARSMTDEHEALTGEAIEGPANELGFDYCVDSVLRTGFLPHWDVEAHSDAPYDVSGLGGNATRQGPRSKLRWLSINTDQMRLVRERTAPQIEANVPRLDGQPLSADNYIEDVVLGFRGMYRFFIRHRDDLLSPSGVLSSFQRQRTRFIFRRTQVYGSILFNALSPNSMRDGIDFSIEIDALSRAYLFADAKPTAWSILSAERAAMERLDFPHFSTAVQSDSLDIGHEFPLPRYFERSGSRQVIDRFEKLSDLDLGRQISLIRGAFYASVAGIDRSNSVVNLKTKACEVDGAASKVTTEELLDAAQAIADIIQRNAISSCDGSVDWIGLSGIPRTERFQYQPLGFNLYDGKSGIALFLAALDRVRRTDQFRGLIDRALQPLRRVFAQDQGRLRRWVQQNEHGGACGVGSILYACVNLSRNLSEPALLDEANRVVASMAEDWIVADRRLDVVSGTAGTLLGILALYRETQNLDVLPMAIACGQHLLDQRIGLDGAPRAWITLERLPLTGFSHGAAGIAYALLQLYAVTDDVAYRDAAQEAIDYERTAFSPSESNWTDFRGHEVRSGKPSYAMSWCHGAPGIALARLGGRSMLSTSEIEREIEVAVEKTRTAPFQSVDFLCCGNTGLADVLLVASKKLDRPAFRTAAKQRIQLTLDHARKKGSYQLSHRAQSNDYQLGFFQGIAGIGYEILRSEYTEQLPSVILWE